MQFIVVIYFFVLLISLSYGSSSNTETKLPERKNRIVPKNTLKGHNFLFEDEDEMQPFELESGNNAAALQQPLIDQSESSLSTTEPSSFSLKEFYAFLLASSIIIPLLISHVGRIILAVDFLILFAFYCCFKFMKPNHNEIN